MTRNDVEHSRQGNGGNPTAIPMLFLEEMPDAMRSLLDQSARLQSEFLTLCTHRAQAWLNWPKQMLACKNPSDLLDAEGAFLTTMQRHYREYFDSILHDVQIEQGGRNGRTGASGKTPPDPGARQPREHERSQREAA